MNKGLVIGVGAAVVLAGLIAFATGGGEPRVDDPDTPYGIVAVDGALAPYSDQGGDVAVGQPMPVADGTNLGGEALTLGPTGSPQAIVFLAHWCGHCQAEVPAVQQWLDDTGGVPGVDIVSVATAIDPGRPNYSPHSWLAREGWDPAVLWDNEDSAVLGAFGGTSFPFWVFVDGEGTVVGRVAGEMGGAQLENILLSLAG